ncbi:treslin [Carcharodon carcharias]|uniref:treslin n=1 Tax=Carcharodon carcharias TaxID=13397 RepID=UPI001B7DDB4C|nr:treslin [Carcharodon carcharias]
MASHNIAFLVDTAASEAGLVRLAALRVLLHSARGSGFHNVRWAFKLFDSAAARARGRGGGRGRGFRELRLRHLEELEEALCREVGPGRERGSAAASSSSSSAATTQTALIEALSDYQWDRPDITSPAKCRRGSGTEAPQPRPRSSLFLFAPCPHSRAQLLGFLQLPATHSCQQLAEKIIPAPVRALLSSHSIALHWVDTQQLQQFIGASDHIGYKMVSEVMRLVGGSLIPFAALMELTLNDSAVLLGKTSQVGLKKIAFEKNGINAKEYAKQRKTVGALFPFDCSMNYIVNVESSYRKMFPLQQGLLTITQGEQKVCCPITLEPVSCSQKHLTAPASIIVKGAVKDWDLQRTDRLSTHAWILQRAKQKETKETYLLQRLLEEMACKNIYLVVDMELNSYLPSCTGVLSPLLSGTAVLTLISWEQEPEFEELLLKTDLTENNQAMSSGASEVVGRALSLFSDITDECQTCSELTVPDWVQLELAETSQQRISFGEGWFPLSELSGASSALMQSFRSMQGEDEKANMDSELALTGQLAEFYQKKSADEAGAAVEQGVKRRRCGPRTPIRQKMRSMSRSLQMLNVARLNLKAQKSQPDGMQLPIGDESTHQSKKRLGSKQKSKRVRKSTVDFKSDEEMVSSLKENYQKHVVNDELSQFSFIQNAVEVIKMYLKSGNTEVFEAACINLIQMQLLKSSKSIRQQYGNQENKELKVRDCQLQVLLRLEMFQQFPSLQSNHEHLEQLVEEMTNLLRIISLTKDTTFLAKFLEEEILNTYLLTVPKILGELYFGLGQNVPARLASVLPADFLSDESMSQKTESPDASQLASLATSTSFAGCEGEQLEELRTRSSRKRRSLPLTRHRTISEVSHNLRQIQIPKKSVKRQENFQSHLPIAIEQAVLPPPSQKEVQEVTKVRRNLFNQEILSPRKKSKMPKSYSESVVEGVRHLRGEEKANKGHRKLLTRKVTETPLHKQVSHRLLDKQIRGRCSESGSDVSIVKESPERALSVDSNMRRSPHIRKVSLARCHSNSFYSGSCSMSRSLERVQSLSRIQAGKAKRADNQIIGSPNQLLFGAVLGLVSPKEKQSSKGYCSDPESLSVVQSPKPTPDKPLSSPNKNRTTKKSPGTSHYLTPKKKTKRSKSPTTRNGINDYLRKESSPWKMATDLQFQSPRRSERLNKETPNKSTPPQKMEAQSPFIMSGHSMLTSPYNNHLSVKPSPRRSARLASPCRNGSTVNVSDMPSKAVQSASQAKSSRKSLSVMNSPVRASKKLSPSFLINNLSKNKSKPCATRDVKLRRCKSDESVISQAPMKCFVVSPAKIYMLKSLKKTADSSCSSDQGKSQKSNASTPCTPRSIWKAGFQTPLKTSVMTRSMYNVPAPDRLGAMQYKSSARTPLKSEMQTPSKYTAAPPKSPVRTRSMFNVTSLKSELKTPSKSTTSPPKSLVRTRSMFSVTPLKSELKTPSKFTATSPKSPVRTRSMLSVTPLKSELKTPSRFTAASPKSPVRTRSMFSVTPSKAEVTDLSKYTATSPDLKSLRIGTLLDVSLSKVDQKVLSKYNSTPLKSPLITQSPSTSNSTPPHLKTPLRTKPGLNMTPSKHEVSMLSKSRLMLCTPLGPMSNEADVVSMKMPGNCTTSTIRLDQILKTPEKNKSTIYNVQRKSSKNHKAFSKSNLEGEHALQESNLWVSIPQINFATPDTNASSVTNHNRSDRSAATSDNLGNLGEDCFNVVLGLNASDSLPCSSQSTASELVSNVGLITERLDLRLASMPDAGAANSQAEERRDLSQVRLVQSESSGLKMKFAVLRKESNSSVSNSVVTTQFPLPQKNSTSYEFRWTPDRRQRLAAARQQIPEFPRKISTPKGRNWPPMPTYEVELEMQDSGLPKLRFKRTNSSAVVSPQLEHSVTKINGNPSLVCVKSGCESPLGERNAQWCVKHSGKMEGGHISPSFCFHSSHNTPAKATPRKGGVQTYICQSYTPTQCSSNTSSPSQADLGLAPWTPSPTHKIRPSQTPDAIKNWPRKKKAATTPLGGKWQKGEPTAMQKEDNFHTEHYSNKAVPLEEIGMEGVSRLQDHSPTIEWDQRFPGSPEEKFGLRSRKRGCGFISPTSEEAKESKKQRKANFAAPFSDMEFAVKEVRKEQSPPCSFSPFCKTFTRQRSIEDEMVFDSPAGASPSCKVKSTLSASGLLALTQSPLLYAGRTPAKKRPGRDTTYEDMQTDASASKRMAIAGDIDQDYSPFSKVPVRRCITKTYSRKKLVS